MQETITKSPETIQVGVLVDADELAEMRALTGINANATAILALARKGARCEKNAWTDWAERRTMPEEV